MMATPPTRAAGSVAVWQPLINALRDELQEFGGLIALLKDEQDAIFANPAKEVSEVHEGVARQLHLALVSTQNRIGLMVAPGRGDTDASLSVDELIASAPDEIRPLLRALFAEVDKLALRAGERGSQNAWLRKRAPELAATVAGRAGSRD